MAYMNNPRRTTSGWILMLECAIKMMVMKLAFSRKKILTIQTMVGSTFLWDEHHQAKKTSRRTKLAMNYENKLTRCMMNRNKNKKKTPLPISRLVPDSS